MNNNDVRKIAQEHGFTRAYFLPLPDFVYDEEQNNIVMNTERYPWARVSLLLVWAYSPYPEGCRIPAYYIASNASYHACVALCRELEGMGCELKRCELPIKQLMTKHRAAIPCRDSLIALPGLGTRVVFQSVLLGSGGENRFEAEEYNVPDDGLCASCRACMNACPANAIDESGYDVKKCMRYYMDGADYPEWVYGIQRTHMGCEVCQAVCPRNAGITPAEPPEDVKAAFDIEALAEGNTKPARLLVGKNFTGRGKLQKEALNFLSRDKETGHER